MNKSMQKFYSLALSALLIFSSISFGVQADERRLVISDVETFLQFAQDCTIDSYSKGLTVELTVDLNLTDTDFESIPIFCGIFLGNNHVVSGYSFTKSASDIGFFRYVEEGASIQDLTVSGSMLPNGTKSFVGLFAGHNAGMLIRCKTSGEVSGDSDVGGIVGVNEESGQISYCANEAKVKGNKRTGGIAGKNKGTISESTNYSEINIEENESATDTGGIAGDSVGIIKNSRNNANIGYQHTGYNTGGIAGIQSGILIGCENHGVIKGRKDIGGIVGQFEPDTELKFGEDPFKALDEELAKLSDLMLQLSEQTQKLGADATADLKALNHAMGIIADETHNTVSEGITDISKTVELVYNSGQLIHQALDGLLKELDVFRMDSDEALTDVSNQLSNIRQDLDRGVNDVNGDLVDIWNSMDRAAKQMDGELKTITKAVNSIIKDIATIENFIQTIEQVVSDNSIPVEQKFESIKKAADSLKTIAIKGSIVQIVDAMENIRKDMSALRSSLDGQMDSLDTDSMEAWNRMNNSADKMEKALDRFQDAWRVFSDQALDELEIVNDETDHIEDIIQNYSENVSNKTQIPLDNVNDQLGAIKDTIDKMADGASVSNTEIHATMQSIINQIRNVELAMMGVTDKPELNFDDISDDVVSKEEIESEKMELVDLVPGTILTSKNTGEVNGDSNVGGIAGTVAIEIGIDPEEDFDLDLAESKLLVDTTQIVRATIQSCSNKGNITTKNDCAGGIVGRAELGAIINSMAVCGVETAGGEHCGGIAGLSRNMIRGCSARCDLTGNGKIGGIAGEGKDISNCYSMIRIWGEGEKQGAIAGVADGTISENYFLKEGVAGIDGIDYEGKAIPLNYEEFAALENIPSELLSLDVIFLADNVIVAVLPVEYGEALEPSEFPDVPKKDGYYGTWEDFDYSEITTSIKVEAVYDDWVSTISSGGEIPLLLAEAEFSPEAKLIVKESSLDNIPLEVGYQLINSMAYEITDVISLPDAIKLRAFAVKEDEMATDIALIKDGKLEFIDAVKDGRYLIFPADVQGSFVLLKKENPQAVPIVAIVTTTVLLFGIAWMRRKKEKKNK